MEGEIEVVPHDPYPELLQAGISRLKAHLARYGYGLAETRPRADLYYLRFGNVECGLLASISVDAAGWHLVIVGQNVRYEPGELTTRVPTEAAFAELLQQVTPPPSPVPRPKPKPRMAEGRMDRLAVLAGSVKLRPPTVDDLLGEDGEWQTRQRQNAPGRR